MENIITGLDIGSGTIRIVVGQISSGGELQILGMTETHSEGVSKGVITDLEDTVTSVSRALDKIERLIGLSINHAYVGISGTDIISQEARGVIAISRADGEVRKDDVERVLEAVQSIATPPNYEILHVIPRSFTVDNQPNIKDPIGMNGVRLEVDAIIVEGSTPYIKNLIKCFEQARIKIENFIFTSLAASKAVLTKRQKELGVVLIDVGGGTTSIAVFEEDDLIATSVIPVGGGHITNDIAIGLRTSIDVAEKIKIEFGNAIPKEIGKKENINLAEIDSSEEGIVSRYHVAEIIEARLEEIFNLVNKELKAIGKDRLLPAGAVLTGGTAKLPGIVDLAKNVLGLPVQTGFPMFLGGLVDKVDEPSFATVICLIVWEREKNKAGGNKFGLSKGRIMGNISNRVSEKMENMKKLFEKFLP